MSRKTVAIAIAQAIALSALAYALPTWQDEEFTLATTAHGVATAIHRAIFYEHQAPFYFAVLALLRSLSPSMFFAREFSVACVVATTLVADRIARAIRPDRDPWIVCALLALNPFVVFAAMEIRLYALALLLQGLLFLCFFRGFFDGHDRRARVGFAILAVLSLYTQYFAAFDVVACVAALAVVRRFRPLLAAVGAGFLAALTFVPMIPLLGVQTAGAMSAAMAGPTNFGGRLLHPVDFIFASSSVALGAIASAIAKLAKIVVPIAVVAAWPRIDRRTLAFLTIALVTHLLYVGVELATHKTLAVPRHFIAMFFPEVMALYTLVGRFRFEARTAWVPAVVIAVALGSSDIGVLAATYGTRSKLGDAARVGAFLSEHAGPGDTIAVFSGDAAPAIARYYVGSTRIVGYPVSLDPDTYTVDQSLVRSQAQGEARLAALPHGNHLWFVEIGACNQADTNGCAAVERAIAARYRIESTTPFHSSIVFELVAKSAAR